MPSTSNEDINVGKKMPSVLRGLQNQISDHEWLLMAINQSALFFQKFFKMFLNVDNPLTSE